MARIEKPGAKSSPKELGAGACSRNRTISVTKSKSLQPVPGRCVAQKKQLTGNGNRSHTPLKWTWPIFVAITVPFNGVPAIYKVLVKSRPTFSAGGKLPTSTAHARSLPKSSQDQVCLFGGSAQNWAKRIQQGPAFLCGSFGQTAPSNWGSPRGRRHAGGQAPGEVLLRLVR